MVGMGDGVRWDPGRLAVAVVAAVFFLAGVLGLASGTRSALPASDAVHLVLGVTGLAVARGGHGARFYLIAGGVVYFLWHYGGPVMLADTTAPLQLTTVNDWLNLWLAISMIALACLVSDRRRPVSESTRDGVELAVSWRQVRVSASTPSPRPRRPRPAAGSRPPAPGRTAYGYVI